MNWALFQNSLLVAGTTALVASSLGAVAAFWLLGLGTRARWTALGLSVAVLALPPFLVANTWLHFLGHTGVWRGWAPLDIYTPMAVVCVLSLMHWPLAMLSIWGAWHRLEPAHLEADPALRGGCLVRVLLWPLGRTALAQSFVLIFVLSLNHFSIPALFQVKVFPAEMWVRFNTSFDTLGALQLSVPLVAASMALIVWLSRHPVAWPHWGGRVSPAEFRRQAGALWFWSAGGVTTGVLGLSVLLPMLQIGLDVRTWTELPGAVAAGRIALWNTLVFAGLAAGVVVMISIACAGSRRIARLGWLVWLPFLLPGVLLGVVLVWVFNRPGLGWYYQSALIALTALALRYLAVGWFANQSAARAVDSALIEQLRLNGAGWWARFRYVYWPQTGSRLALATYLVFLLCLWDVESLILVVPPDGETLALRIFNLLHYGHNSQVNALCLLLLGIALMPLLLWLGLRGAGYRLVRAGGVWIAVPVLFLAGTGCSPQPEGMARVDSGLFYGVQVIASRGAGVGQVNKPRSVAVDRSNHLFVIDLTGRVQKFDLAGRHLLQWQMPETDVGRPKGLCFDTEGCLVVNEPHYSRVNHFTADGQAVRQWGVKGTRPGQLGFPRAVAVNSHREIFVSEYAGAERVQRFRLPPPAEPEAAPVFLNAFGAMGSGPGQFNRPEGLAIDRWDRVYVADSCNHRIQVFSREGAFVASYGRPGRGPGELSYPYDICIDTEGRQYVCEFGNSRIQVFAPDHRPIETLGGPGPEPGRFSNPWGVALDGAGNLYVADSQNHRIQKFLRRPRTIGAARS